MAFVPLVSSSRLSAFSLVLSVSPFLVLDGVYIWIDLWEEEPSAFSAVSSFCFFIFSFSLSAFSLSAFSFSAFSALSYALLASAFNDTAERPLRAEPLSTKLAFFLRSGLWRGHFGSLVLSRLCLRIFDFIVGCALGELNTSSLNTGDVIR